MARYSPGEWFAIVTPGGVALLPPTVPAATAEQVWTALRAGQGLGAVIEGLVGAFGTSLSLLPDFAVLVGDPGSEVRVAVRGGATARVLVDGEPVEITGAGVTTWSEQALAGVTEAVLLAPGGGATASLPVVDGIVPARSVEIPGQAREDVAAPAPATVAPTPQLAAREPAALEPTASETTWVEPADEAAHDFAALLFGETVISSVEAAAVREPEAELTVAPAPLPAPAPAPADRPEPAAGAEGAAPAAAPPAMIHSVPTVAPAPQPAGDHDGQTVLVDEQRAHVSVGSSQPTTPLTRNPPVLLTPDQGRVALDRGAIVGTRPQLSRVQGSNVPHLVTVTSPSGEISRNHLELRVEATTVLAVDLNSTNGTVLLRAGSDPIRLHPGEPSILVPGDRIDLGDGVTLGFEGLR